MSTLFRAVDEPAVSRTDYWHHVVSDMATPLELRLPDGPDRRDQLLVGKVGTVRVAELSCYTPGRAQRTARTIRRRDTDLCKIDVLVRGTGVVRQDGREARLRSGDLTLVDLSRPAGWVMSPMRSIAVLFPRTQLALRPEQIARLTAVRIPGDRGIGALVSSLARQLVERLDEHGPAEEALLGSASVDLITTALTGRLNGDATIQDVNRRTLLMRIHTFIEERLGDPELSPAMIAAAHHISLRYLYKLFDTEEQTVASWIRRRRLERCRRDLVDPLLRTRPVSAIAARWGLPNPAHFSRLFRKTYGVAPAEYRDLGEGSVAPGTVT